MMQPGAGAIVRPRRVRGPQRDAAQDRALADKIPDVNGRFLLDARIAQEPQQRLVEGRGRREVAHDEIYVGRSM